ncbi:hypothetical protein KKA66_02585 [Patescibacteria group bacterium]|nr:hypothetical protein [Patescibacteria group bacterium]
MHDINLLPVDDRKRELEEIKKRQKAKSKVKIEMSSPEKKIKEITEKKLGNFLAGIKNIFKRFKKEKEDKNNKPGNNMQDNPVKRNKPEIPRHLDDISSNKHSKEFYFKTDNLIPSTRDSGETEKELEDIVTYKPKDNPPSLLSDPLSLRRAGSQQSTANSQQIKKTNSLLPEASLPRVKAETNFNINLIPTGIKKIYQNRNNLKIYLISVLAAVVGCILVLVMAGQLVGAQRSDLQRLEKSIEDTQNQIILLEDTQSPVNEFIKLLRNVKGVINKHIRVSEIFKLLEKNTLKDVYYTSLNIDTNNSLVSLSVATKDYTTAAKQILIFRSLVEVNQLEAKSMSLVEEKEQTTDKEKKLGISPQIKKFVTFDLVLKLKADIFNYGTGK